uniref:Protein lin-37 homolog n=1 Tax=Phallusia mammillata TaxID=59560 RepID=A0A6F9DKK4_9ASCI|nr:protein lin-37 homolog [Phallusia mammillata]
MADDEYQQELDSNDARADFENVLQGMLDKANAGESFSAIIPAVKEEVIDSSQEETRKFPVTPTKSSRKRKRKEEGKDDKQKSNSFIMKLFDRSIDLAAFNEDTPLYPICRAWMNNDPSGKKTPLRPKKGSDEEANSNSEDEDASGNVTEIPTPNVRWNNIDINGKYISPRVPATMPHSTDRINDYFVSHVSPPPPETLLINHIRRWRAIRERWTQKSCENDARYEDGMVILRDMFNRQLYGNSESQ